MNPTEAGFCWVDGKPFTADDPLMSAIAFERDNTSQLIHRNGSVMAYPQNDFVLMLSLFAGTDAVAQGSKA